MRNAAGVDCVHVLETELQVKLDETEQMALKGGKKQLHKLEARVSTRQKVQPMRWSSRR